MAESAKNEQLDAFDPSGAIAQEHNEERRTINVFLEQSNIAPLLDDDTLEEMGTEVVENYNIDEESRRDWVHQNDEYVKLATQVAEQKSQPWPGAANIKYPLLTTASLQFAARAYPALVRQPAPVAVRVVGEDPTGEKADSAERVSKHMSYQVLEEMTEWEEDMDKLTFILPILGTCFKKTYYSSILKRNVSKLVLPKDLVVHYYTKTLEEAERITHKFELTHNQVIERVNRGIYLDQHLGEPRPPKEEQRKVQDEATGMRPPSPNEHPPYTILEQHTYWDLDEDGYKEPYIITVDLTSQKVLRVVANYHLDTIEQMPDGRIVAIKPVQYFTKYSFLPNPDGGFYDIGFGALLGPLNRTANSLINMLLDGGKLANMPSGFIARGIRFKGGRKTISPGQWIPTLSPGDDLRKGIVPLPVKEPSNVLFNLLGSIIQAGQKISSVSDIMQGINPGQNQPATTSMAVLEQGMKVFSAIHKRMYRSLKHELRKLYNLNCRYVRQDKYFAVLDADAKNTTKVFHTDYSLTNMDVVPSADPKMVTEAYKLMKAQALQQLLEQGMPLNVEATLRRILDAQEQPDIAELLKPNPPSAPDPKIQLEAEKLAHQRDKDAADYTLKEKEIEAMAVNKYAQSYLFDAQAHAQKLSSTLEVVRHEIEQLRADIESAKTSPGEGGQGSAQPEQAPQGGAGQGGQGSPQPQ